MANFKSRQQAELNGLTRQRIGAGDHGLARDHGRERCQSYHRDQRPIRKHQEERVLDPLRIGNDQCALPHIIQRQRRQHNGKPGDLNRPFAKMPEVGVESLSTRDRQKHRAERHKADDAMMDHERDGVERI